MSNIVGDNNTSNNINSNSNNNVDIQIPNNIIQTSSEVSEASNDEFNNPLGSVCLIWWYAMLIALVMAGFASICIFGVWLPAKHRLEKIENLGLRSCKIHDVYCIPPKTTLSDLGLVLTFAVTLTDASTVYAKGPYKEYSSDWNCDNSRQGIFNKYSNLNTCYLDIDENKISFDLKDLKASAATTSSAFIFGMIFTAIIGIALLITLVTSFMLIFMSLYRITFGKS